MSRAPCPRPSDCWAWINPQDVVGHALSAFYAACRAIEPPPDQPWFVDGSEWADRETFLGELTAAFMQRVNAQAAQVGIGRPDSTWRELPEGLSWPHGGEVSP